MSPQAIQVPLLVYLVLIWSTFWKGIGLWRSAHSNQKYWFIAMLILNTIGILELIYLFRFAKNRLTYEQIQGWFHSLSRKST
jgi:hypothetical protein